MYKRTYMIALDFKFSNSIARGAARDRDFFKKLIARIDLTASACDEID